MKAKTVSPQTLQLQKRFFEAIDELIAKEKLAGLQTFCTTHNLHKAKYSNLRSAARNPEHESAYKFIDIDAIIYIVTDYGVSCQWLITGKGKMFS